MQSESTRLCACGCGLPLPPANYKRPSTYRGYIQHHGNPATAAADRLWAKTERGPDHWLWTGSLSHGYGLISRGGHPMVKVGVHRLAWELASGQPIPVGFDVLHVCDIPTCVRNDEPGTYLCNGKLLPRFGHLFLGTDADNTADKVRKGRQDAKLTLEQTTTIRARRAAGESLAALAQEYRMDVSTLHALWRGDTWKQAR